MKNLKKNNKKKAKEKSFQIRSKAWLHRISATLDIQVLLFFVFYVQSKGSMLFLEVRQKRVIALTMRLRQRKLTPMTKKMNLKRYLLWGLCVSDSVRL